MNHVFVDLVKNLSTVMVLYKFKLIKELKKLKLDYVTILINLKVLLESSKEKENKQNDISKQILNNKKIGRNEPCFCGSGKKFKHCHGAI